MCYININTIFYDISDKFDLIVIIFLFTDILQIKHILAGI